MTTSSPVRIVGEENYIATPSGKPLFVATEEGYSIDVFIQDQVTAPFHYYLMNEQKDDITLTAPIATGDTTISVSAGHGFTAGGEDMVGRDGDRHFQERVTAVAVNDITIAAPVGEPFAVANTQIIRGDINMNVNGSVTPVIYRCSINGVSPVDIQTVLFTVQHSTVSDDSLFGDLAALTNGILLQKIGDEPNAQPIAINMTQNQDFREFGGDIEYTQKAGGGKFSTNILFDVKSLYGIVVRLDPRRNDCIRVTVRDNLSSLLRLRTSVMGQMTLGE